MKKATHDEAVQHHLRLFDAIAAVWLGHLEFQNEVRRGHRERLEKSGCPSALKVEALFFIEVGKAIADRKNTDLDEIRLQLVDAVMYVWNRIDRRFHSYVINAVESIAVQTDEDPSVAFVETTNILLGARSPEDHGSVKDLSHFCFSRDVGSLGLIRE